MVGNTVAKYFMKRSLQSLDDIKMNFCKKKKKGFQSEAKVVVEREHDVWNECFCIVRTGFLQIVYSGGIHKETED